MMQKSRSKHYMTVEIIIRVVLGILFLLLEYAEPFHRKILQEELWLYKNPRTTSYVPNYMLWPIIATVPLLIICVCCLINKIKMDGILSILALTLAFGINGVVTNTVKLIVGRPRPDFFYRCFPDGKETSLMSCTGDRSEIREGLKSFPSGHSSFAFASMAFCTLYMCGKFQVFTPRGRGESWRLLISILPLFGALIIALSRTCDYHHHWQDVLVGSVLGVCITWICYFQYYPSLNHPNCAIPYGSISPLIENNLNQTPVEKSESLEDVTVKWI